MVIQTGHNAFINSISFSPWQKYVGDIKFSYDSKIFEAVYHNRLKLFDTLTGNLIATTPGARKSNGVRTIAIIPDGNYIATADDFKISLWTITGKTFFAKNMDLFMKSEEEIKLKPFISK
ncbi:MAG: hypothetical protein GY760_23010 [Deltaproteobacteria bacterium]|nr:hypothetical protein [Deltaproteobacteria bacterium]